MNPLRVVTENYLRLSKRVAAAMLVWLVLCGFMTSETRAAKGDMEVIVSSDRTEAGKHFKTPTAEHPIYCTVVSAGAKELGGVVAGEKIPTAEEVDPMVKKALLKQHYLIADDKHPDPELLVVYSWGSINPDDADASSGPDSDPTPQSTQQTQQQMLSIVANQHLDLSPNSVDRTLFMPNLSDGRYFILVGGYDYAALKKGKKIMLWRTRLSCYNTGGGGDLVDVLPRMLDIGAKTFGSDGFPASEYSKVKRGSVQIGEAVVKEYIISGTTVTPLPPRQPAATQTPANTSGTKAAPTPAATPAK